MKKRKKNHARLFALNLLSLAVVIFFCYLLYVFVYRGKVEPPLGVRYTTRNPARHASIEEQLRSLSSYPELTRLAIEGRENERQWGTYVIPGLKSTRTLTVEPGSVVDSCCSMTPQGITVTDRYILITAYCKTKLHSSVIYVLNKVTHNFIKQIVLPGRPHAGGIAWDEEHGRIWYSSHAQGIAQAVSIRMEDIQNYRFEREHLPVSVESSYLYGVIRDSFLTIRDGCLYVGYFSGTGNGTLVKYEIKKDGSLAAGEQEGLNLPMGLNFAVPVESGEIPSCVQGIAFYEDYLLVSQSYGIMPSVLGINPCSEGLEYGASGPIHEYQMPERMEQICVDGDQLYLIFESGSYAYRSSSFHIVDRTLKINLKKMKEELGIE